MTRTTYPNFRITYYTDQADVQSEYFNTMEEAVKAAEDTLREMDADSLVGQVEILMSNPDGLVRKVGNYYSAAMEAEHHDRDFPLTAQP